MEAISTSTFLQELKIIYTITCILEKIKKVDLVNIFGDISSKVLQKDFRNSKTKSVCIMSIIYVRNLSTDCYF